MVPLHPGGGKCRRGRESVHSKIDGFCNGFLSALGLVSVVLTRSRKNRGSVWRWRAQSRTLSGRWVFLAERLPQLGELADRGIVVSSPRPRVTRQDGGMGAMSLATAFRFSTSWGAETKEETNDKTRCFPEAVAWGPRDRGPGPGTDATGGAGQYPMPRSSGR